MKISNNVSALVAASVLIGAVVATNLQQASAASKPGFGACTWPGNQDQAKLGHNGEFLLLECCKFPLSSDLKTTGGHAECGKILCSTEGWRNEGANACVPALSPPDFRWIPDKVIKTEGGTPAGAAGEESLEDKGTTTENESKITRNESMISRPGLLGMEPSNNTHD